MNIADELLFQREQNNKLQTRVLYLERQIKAYAMVTVVQDYHDRHWWAEQVIKGTLKP